MKTYVVTDAESLRETLETAGRGDKIVIAEGAFDKPPKLSHDGTRWREVPAPSSTGWTVASVSKSWIASYPVSVHSPRPVAPAPASGAVTMVAPARSTHGDLRLLAARTLGCEFQKAGTAPRSCSEGVRRRIAWNVNADGTITGVLIE